MVALLACTIEAAPPSENDAEHACEATTWFLDRDGDGHGAPAETYESCEAPVGYVAVGDDCADDDAGRVEDCWNSGWVRPAEADARLSIDHLGGALRTARDLDGKTGTELAFAVTDEASVHVFDGGVSGEVGENEAVATLGEIESPRSLAAVDFDGSGTASLVGEFDGGVFVASAPLTGTSKFEGALLTGEGVIAAVPVVGADDREGLLVARQDAGEDPVIAWYYQEFPENSELGALAYSAILDPQAPTMDVLAAGAGGDVDGDGGADLMFALYDRDSGLSAFALYDGPTAESIDDATFLLLNTLGALPTSVAVVPDCDGDGLDDLAAALPELDVDGVAQAGLVELWTGIFDETAASTSLVYGDEAYAYVGATMAFGDIDADGVGDAVIGDSTDTVGVVFGPVSGAYLSRAAADTLLATEGARAADDFDGDGFADVVTYSEGAALVFRGAPR